MSKIPATEMPSATETLSEVTRGLLAFCLLASVGLLATVAGAQDGGEDPKPAPAAGEADDPLLDPVDPPEVLDRPGDTGARPPSAAPQGGVGGPPTPPTGAARESMWRAPTAEDWAKPCVLTFQRTWADAVAVARETNRPLLLCINMDGEIASEHYAGVRYREPDIATLYEPYVCVAASVYRHNPVDHDEAGNRIPCPRFGSVTCGEHIELEPFLYEKFMDGVRVAPRHIMVELDGSESYDIYYANDTESVFKTIRAGIEKRTAQPTPVVRGDRPMVERVSSRDIADREAVEAAYRAGDKTKRDALLRAALENPETAPTELLRLAMFGLDTDLAKLAREALAQTNSDAATPLLADALGTSLEPAERDALIGALERIGTHSRRARWLAAVHKGLASSNGVVDPAGWTQKLTAAQSQATARYDRVLLEQRRAITAETAKSRPDDAAARLDLAEATLTLARKGAELYGEDERTAASFKELMFHDVQRDALAAEKLGSTDWRVDALIALSTYYLGDKSAAYPRAEKAVAAMPEGDPSWNAMALLTVFGEARWEAIREAVRAKRDWPPSWLTDLNAAYAVLLKHPLGTAEQVVWHYDVLVWLRAWRPSQNVLEAGLERFPDASVLHERQRGRVLQRRGPEGLTETYTKLVAEHGPGGHRAWQAGRAVIMAAEFYRRAAKTKEALDAYAQGIAFYEQSIATDPATTESSNHFIALALGGRARLAYEQGDDDQALVDALASIARRPASAGSTDGVGISPVETARMLRQRLIEKERTDDAAKIAAALDTVPAELKIYDRSNPNANDPVGPEDK